MEKTKYDHGLQKKHAWIFCKKKNGLAFAKVVEDRTKNTLLNVIIKKKF